MRSEEGIATAARSVSAKIKDYARNRGEDPMQVQRRFVLERFLARLSASEHAGTVALKGGMLLLALTGDQMRPTQDVDLHMDDGMDEAAVSSFVAAVAGTPPPEEDGLTFDLADARVDGIMDGVMPGFRVRFEATLHTSPRPTKVSVRLDLAWGDTVLARKVEIPPAIRGFPPVTVRAHSWASVVAEKLHAMARHGAETTRLKDFYDVAVLSREVRFAGPELSAAVRETFLAWGATPVTVDLDCLSRAWAEANESEWRRFRQGKALKAGMGSLADAVDEIRNLAMPVLAAVSAGGILEDGWVPGSGWEGIAAAPPSP